MAGSLYVTSSFSEPSDSQADKNTSANKRLKKLVTTFKDITIPSQYRKDDMFWNVTRHYFYKNLETLASLHAEPTIIDKKALQLAVQYATEVMDHGGESEKLQELSSSDNKAEQLTQSEFEKRMAVEIASIRRKKHLARINSPLYELETNHLYLMYLIVDQEEKISLLQSAIAYIDCIGKIGRNNFSILIPVENRKDLFVTIEQLQKIVLQYNTKYVNEKPLTVALGACEIDVASDKSIQKSIITAFERARRAKKSHLQQVAILKSQLQENPPHTPLYQKVVFQYNLVLNSPAVDITSEIKAPKRGDNKV